MCLLGVLGLLEEDGRVKGTSGLGSLFAHALHDYQDRVEFIACLTNFDAGFLQGLKGFVDTP
jgi:hypothetical protein